MDAMKSGNRWCSSPSELDEFVTFVASHAVQSAVAGARLVGVELDLEEAG
jgi:hypothetical protein